MSSVEDTIGKSNLPNDFYDEISNEDNTDLPNDFFGDNVNNPGGDSDLPGGFHGDESDLPDGFHGDDPNNPSGGDNPGGDSDLPGEFHGDESDLPGGFHGDESDKPGWETGEEEGGEPGGDSDLPGGFHGDDPDNPSGGDKPGGDSGDKPGGDTGDKPNPGYDPDNIFSDPAFLVPGEGLAELDTFKKQFEYIKNVFVGGKIQSIISQASDAFQKAKEKSIRDKKLEKYYKSDLYKYIKNSDVNALKQDLDIAKQSEDEIKEKQGIPKLSSGKPKYYTQSPTLKGAETSIGFSSKVEENALLSAGVMNRLDNNFYTSFSRFGFVDPYTSNTNNKEYIFITKPDLHLFNSGTPNPELMNNSAFFHDNLLRYKEVAHQLQYTFWEGSFGPFIQILSNSYNGDGVEVPGTNAEMEDTSTNVYGININYRGSSYESDLNTDVNISFKDSKHLEVYMLFKMYDEYEKLKWKGLVTPTRINYVYRKILHDMMTMYKFVVGEDGITLRYWARYTGGCPKSTSREIFGSYPNGEITLNTSWQFNFFSDMDPIILSDFNRLTTNGRSRCKKDSSGFPQPLPIAYGNGDNETEWPFTAGIYSNKSDDRQSRMNKYYLLWFGRR